MMMFRYQDGSIDIVFRSQREQYTASDDSLTIFLSFFTCMHSRHGIAANLDWDGIQNNLSEAFPRWKSFARAGERPITCVKFIR